MGGGHELPAGRLGQLSAVEVGNNLFDDFVLAVIGFRGGDVQPT